ncbi:MAG TPA: Xaa-Pro peptidase family protein [bacterium]|nr:Xaa-Pro peptidase family protein [bacterium]
MREFIDKRKLPALLIKNPSNIFYLTGLLEIEGILVVDTTSIHLFAPLLYHQEVVDLSPVKIHIIKYKKDKFKKFLKRYKKTGLIEAEFSFSTWNAFSKDNIKLVPLPDFIKQMRMIKEKEEIQLIKKALEINRKVFRDIEKEIKIGMEETVIAGRVHYLIRKYGGRREAFEPIIASGVHSSYPHHKNRKKGVEKGKPLIIDAGVDLNGYKSDLTVTLFPGDSPDKKFMEYFKILKDVQNSLMDFVKIGMTGRALHNYAVKFLKKKCLERYFIHGLGHGVGIDVHELPMIAPGSKDKLKEGCVFTIEPGIYIPGEGGIRLEEMVFL